MQPVNARREAARDFLADRRCDTIRTADARSRHAPPLHPSLPLLVGRLVRPGRAVAHGCSRVPTTRDAASTPSSESKAWPTPKPWDGGAMSVDGRLDKDNSEAPLQVLIHQQMQTPRRSTGLDSTHELGRTAAPLDSRPAQLRLACIGADAPCPAMLSPAVELGSKTVFT